MYKNTPFVPSPNEHNPSDFTQIKTLVDLLRLRAEQQPNDTLYTFLNNGEQPQESWTYAQLDRKARAIGARLQELGAFNQRVLLLYPPGLDYIAGFMGCLYAGAIAVPIMPPRRNKVEERLLAVAADADAKVALTTQKLRVMIKLKYAFSSAFNNIKLVAGTQINDSEAARWNPPAIDSKSLAFLQYTSGSTGVPKGVMISHENLLHNSKLIQSSFGSNVQSRGLIWLPFYHDMGLIGGVLQPLYTGFPCVYMSPIDFLQNPYRWLKAISDYKSTISGGPNFAYEMCIKKITPEMRSGLDLSSWQIAFSGAEPVRAATLERFAQEFGPYGFNKNAFLSCYGLAESTVFTSGSKADALPIIKSVDSKSLMTKQIHVLDCPSVSSTLVTSCGEAWHDQRFSIIDPERRAVVPDKQIGEIWVTGPSVAQGYWNRPQETQETFGATLATDDQTAYLRTGDLGFSIDGELFVTGRLKDLIIIRGRNYYPQDIELTVESSHPALRSGCTAAFSVDVEEEEKLVIVQEVTRQSVRNLNSTEVIEAIRSAVAKQHELQVFAIHLLRPSRIPKTSSGKIQRHASKNGYLAGTLETVETWQADLAEIDATRVEDIETDSSDRSSADNIRRWIVRSLAQKANISARNVLLDKPFIDYGLDSVAAVELVQELNEWLDGLVEIEPTTLWDFPTVESLVGYIVAQVDLPDDVSLAHPANLQTPPTNESSASQNALDNADDASSLEDDMARLETLLG